MSQIELDFFGVNPDGALSLDAEALNDLEKTCEIDGVRVFTEKEIEAVESLIKLSQEPDLSSLYFIENRSVKSPEEGADLLIKLQKGFVNEGLSINPDQEDDLEDLILGGSGVKRGGGILSDEFKDEFNLVEGQKVGKDAEIALLQKFNKIVELNLGNDRVIARLVTEAAEAAKLKNTTIQTISTKLKFSIGFMGYTQFSILCKIYDKLFSTFNGNKIKNSDVIAFYFLGKMKKRIEITKKLMENKSPQPTLFEKSYSKVIFFGGDGVLGKNNAGHYFDPELGKPTEIREPGSEEGTFTHNPLCTQIPNKGGLDVLFCIKPGHSIMSSPSCDRRVLSKLVRILHFNHNFNGIDKRSDDFNPLYNFRKNLCLFNGGDVCPSLQFEIPKMNKDEKERREGLLYKENGRFPSHGPLGAPGYEGPSTWLTHITPADVNDEELRNDHLETLGRKQDGLYFEGAPDFVTARGTDLKNLMNKIKTTYKGGNKLLIIFCCSGYPQIFDESKVDGYSIYGEYNSETEPEWCKMKTGVGDQILIYPSIHYYLRKGNEKAIEADKTNIEAYSSTMDADQKISKYVPVTPGSDNEIKICAPYFELSYNIEEGKTPEENKDLIEQIEAIKSKGIDTTEQSDLCQIAYQIRGRKGIKKSKKMRYRKESMKKKKRKKSRKSRRSRKSKKIRRTQRNKRRKSKRRSKY